jgi:hypothetical protein
MSNAWQVLPEGHNQLLQALGLGLDEVARELQVTVANNAPPHTSRRTAAYRRTILRATWINGLQVYPSSGKKVRPPAGFAISASANTIQALVFSTSSLSPMLELRGARAHLIPMPSGGLGRYGTRSVRRIQHPGFQPRPHFAPAVGTLAQTAARAMQVGVGRSRGVVL